MLTFNHIFNGTQCALNDLLDAMFDAIAKEYDLDAADVKKTALSADTSSVKLKLVKVPPKKLKGFVPPKKPTKLTGYQFYCKTTRPETKQLLIDNEDERTFKNKDGIIVEIGFDKKGNINPMKINQKCAQLWSLLSEEERQEWKDKAEVENKEVAEKAASNDSIKEPAQRGSHPKKNGLIKASARGTKVRDDSNEKNTEEEKPTKKGTAKSSAKKTKVEDDDNTENVNDTESTNVDESEKSLDIPPRKNGAGRKQKPKGPEQPLKKVGRPPKGTARK